MVLSVLTVTRRPNSLYAVLSAVLSPTAFAGTWARLACPVPFTRHERWVPDLQCRPREKPYVSSNRYESR